MPGKEKLPKQVSIAIWLAFLAIVATVYIVKIRDRQRLTSNSAYTEGIIQKISEVAKGEQYINYAYTVSGKSYKGSASVSFCKGCKSDCCQTGTKVKVQYERSNPENSVLMHQQ